MSGAKPGGGNVNSESPGNMSGTKTSITFLLLIFISPTTLGKVTISAALVTLQTPSKPVFSVPGVLARVPGPPVAGVPGVLLLLLRAVPGEVS